MDICLRSMNPQVGYFNLCANDIAELSVDECMTRVLNNTIHGHPNDMLANGTNLMTLVQ